MSEVLKSHHLMLSFHDKYEDSSALKKVIDPVENQELRNCLKNGRKQISQSIQWIIADFIKNTENVFYSLSIKELFDVL